MRAAADLVFILSDNRSGSTLLDQLLGAHPEITSVGEIHWLDAYVRQDRGIYDPVHPLVCSCGQLVADCIFWRDVGAAVGRRLDSLLLRPQCFNRCESQRMPTSTICDPVRHLQRRLLVRAPSLFRYRAVQRVFGGKQLAWDNIALFDAVQKVTGSRYLVDSSKRAYRFRAIRDFQPDRVRAIFLARDYRAVVYSKMKRGQSIAGSATDWRKRMEQIDALTADLPAAQVYRLKYESLCDDPQVALQGVCSFLGVEFSAAMLERPTADTHHIGGSPSKFDSSRRAIVLDDTYKTAFDPESLSKLKSLVGHIPDAWGY